MLTNALLKMFVTGRWRKSIRQFGTPLAIYDIRDGGSCRGPKWPLFGNLLPQPATQGFAIVRMQGLPVTIPDDGEEGELLHLASNPLF